MVRKYLGTLFVVTGLIVGMSIFIIILSSNMAKKSDVNLAEIDRFIESHEVDAKYMRSKSEVESETVQLTYSVYLAEKAEEEAETESQEPDIYQMDVWQLGLYLYGISELDTTRTLKLITYEGYGESVLSYYVACCCWVRCTNGYLGFDNLYSSFGGADTSYNEWMDEIEIADYAYDALWRCYMSPSYVTSCNGMEVPEEYVYAEYDGNNMIYVW